jgi:hypothetical protein
MMMMMMTMMTMMMMMVTMMMMIIKYFDPGSEVLPCLARPNLRIKNGRVQSFHRLHFQPLCQNVPITASKIQM